MTKELIIEPAIMNGISDNNILIMQIIPGYQLTRRHSEIIYSATFNLPVDDKPIKKIIITYEY